MLVLKSQKILPHTFPSSGTREAMPDPAAPPWLHLISAFLAMEPSDSLLSLAKVCGDGSVTERVQRFIWDYCITRAVGKAYAPYLRNFLKKLIVEVESNHTDVLDEIYELYTDILTSLKDDRLVERSLRVTKTITFLFPEDCIDFQSCPKSWKLVVPLQCSLNMLEGDTGCSIWPSSLLLSEFILSFPEIFRNKSCFEVGSGVGLVGICLAHVKASKVILTDGDLLTLDNMRSNLELNLLRTDASLSESVEDPNVVQCVHLPWESASEREVSIFTPEVILGADVLYDRSSLPDLVRVLAILLNQRKSHSPCLKESSKGSTPAPNSNTNDINVHGIDACNRPQNAVTGGRVAYIATVIRNPETFNYFLSLVEQADLSIADIKETKTPFNLLPYMQSYNRSNIRLFTVSCRT